jgi:hypothetical protein
LKDIPAIELGAAAINAALQRSNLRPDEIGTVVMGNTVQAGIGPGGEGDNTILAFGPEKTINHSWKVQDPDLSPLDLTIAPNGNVIVSSEHPFGALDAVTTIREYGRFDGRLMRVLVPDHGTEFRKPRGLRFASDGKLYCVAQDEVPAFDFATGQSLGPVVKLPGLNGQAVIFFG